MAPTVQTLLIENNPVDLANIRNYLQREAPHIVLSIADSLSVARDNLKTHSFDAVLLNHGVPDGTTHDFLTFIQNQAEPVVTIVLLNGDNYRLVSDFTQSGAHRTLIKGPGYWECLPALIEQAIQHNRLLAIQQAETLQMRQILDALQEGIVLLDAQSRVVFINKSVMNALDQSSDQARLKHCICPH